MSLYARLCLAFLVVWGVGLSAADPTLTSLLLWNGLVQVVWFTLVAALPTWRTGRMSWVDIAWPFGVAWIGVACWFLGDAHVVRRGLVAGVYGFIGLRMGLGAVVMAFQTGVILRTEFPRYAYRRMKLEEAGVDDPRGHMVVEVMTQGLANASILALPGFLIATGGDAALSPWEIAGFVLWAVAYGVETTADAQKLLFVSRDEGRGVCDVGLWRYSRHPNYFAEWLVWTGLVVAAVPSWWALRPTEPVWVWVGLGGGALAASGMMYTTLVHLTGAVPAEYFSVRKRPGYRAYQERTSRFFPWFPRG